MRASEDHRERAVAALGRGYVDGQLSLDTFVGRLERAFAARRIADLRGLVADLPPDLRWWERTCLVAARVRAALFGPQALPVFLGSAPSLTGGRSLVLGRAPWCNLVLPEPTVSRRHAELRRDGAAWTIVDLGSRNGTWVNGWRVDRATVRRGDRVHLGSQRLVVR